VMASDRRVMNVEREVLRGALAVLSDEKGRTRHMEAMLDAATRNVGAEGTEKRLVKVLATLRQNPARAETAAVVAAAIAAADDRFPPEESQMLERMMRDLNIDPKRAQELLDELAGLVKE
jgi:tellurite resistance protein